MVFWDIGPNVVHLVARSEASETPGGTECTDYTAVCRELGFEYSIGTPYSTKFAESFEVAQQLSNGPLTKCPMCFSKW